MRRRGSTQATASFSFNRLGSSARVLEDTKDKIDKIQPRTSRHPSHNNLGRFSQSVKSPLCDSLVSYRSIREQRRRINITLGYPFNRLGENLSKTSDMHSVVIIGRSSQGPADQQYDQHVESRPVKCVLGLGWSKNEINENPPPRRQCGSDRSIPLRVPF
jgi:hypothetical protein